jgi:hypothetical protein
MSTKKTVKQSKPVEQLASDWVLNGGLWIPPTTTNKEFKVIGFKPDKG